MADVLTVNREGAVVTLTLNRPDKRNALNHALVTELKAVLRTLASDEGVRVLILTGVGTVFSAGADLAALQNLQSASPGENLADSDHLAELFRMLYLHPKPVIAKINGHAIAGGCGLAAVCDYAIAAEQAKVGFTEVQIGFVPAIVAVFILRKMGETRAREVLLGGKLYTAAEGAEMNLLTRAVPADDLDAAVNTLATHLATQTSGSAVALTKRIIAQVSGAGLEEGLRTAAQANAFARSTEDCQAGIRAFLNKEAPPWKS